MPNHVTNRLEINADRETVQKVMNFLKGKTDDDNTPCYIDFNNIIPMPEELLIEKSRFRYEMSRSNAAAAILFFIGR